MNHKTLSDYGIGEKGQGTDTNNEKLFVVDLKDLGPQITFRTVRLTLWPFCPKFSLNNSVLIHILVVVCFGVSDAAYHHSSPLHSFRNNIHILEVRKNIFKAKFSFISRCFSLLCFQLIDEFGRFAVIMGILHFIKRELESVFVHIFGRGTVPVKRIFTNSAHYWITYGLLTTTQVFFFRSEAHDWPSSSYYYVFFAVWSVSQKINKI